MTTVLPVPTYVLARAAWIPTPVIWHADARFTRLAGASCADYAAALAASWQLRLAKTRRIGKIGMSIVTLKERRWPATAVGRLDSAPAPR